MPRYEISITTHDGERYRLRVVARSFDAALGYARTARTTDGRHVMRAVSNLSVTRHRKSNNERLPRL